VEALVRSLLLVFMDNATAEYTFVTTFFTVDPISPQEIDNALFSPALLSPGGGERRMSVAGSEAGARRNRAASVVSAGGMQSLAAAVKEEQASSDAIWKQIMDPVLEYTQVSVQVFVHVDSPHIFR
jgi:hypothetical protein